MNTWTYNLPIEKSWVVKQDGKQYHYISGYASDNSVDRDGDRMSPRALKSMQDAIANGMSLFENHSHNWDNTLGVITKAENRNGYLWIEAKLEDPTKNPKVDLLLHKMSIGEKIGLSIGGDMDGSHWEEDKSLGKRVRVIDNVKLYEISVVGLPSNPNSYLLGSTFKSFGRVFVSPEAEIAKSLLDELQKAAPVAIRPAGTMGYRDDTVAPGILGHGPSTGAPAPSPAPTPEVLQEEDEAAAQLTVAHEAVKALSNYIVKAKAENRGDADLVKNNQPKAERI